MLDEAWAHRVPVAFDDDPTLLRVWAADAAARAASELVAIGEYATVGDAVRGVSRVAQIALETLTR